MVADREAAAERDRIGTLRLRTGAKRGRGLPGRFGALADRCAVVAAKALRPTAVALSPSALPPTATAISPPA